MNLYEVTKRTGETVNVEAKTEFVAIAKAHKEITGEKATGKKVTWHGLHAECLGHSYNRPVLLWSPR